MPPRRSKKKDATPLSLLGYKNDLPVRTVAEAQAERKAFFDKAWAQHNARAAANARGEAYVPDWQRTAKKTATSTSKERWNFDNSDDEEAFKSAKKPKTMDTHTANVIAQLNADSDED